MKEKEEKRRKEGKKGRERKKKKKRREKRKEKIPMYDNKRWDIAYTKYQTVHEYLDMNIIPYLYLYCAAWRWKRADFTKERASESRASAPTATLARPWPVRAIAALVARSICTHMLSNHGLPCLPLTAAFQPHIRLFHRK